MPRYGLVHASGAPATDPLSGVLISFDSPEEAEDWREPGFSIVRLVDDPSAEGGVRFVPLNGPEHDQP